MINSIKKSWLNVVGAADTVFSRINKRPLTWAIGGFLGAVAGAVAGIVVGNIQQDDANNWDAIDADRKLWVVEKNNYEALPVISSFPKMCKLGGSWHFAAKGPNGDYALYSGAKGWYEPVTDEGDVEDFVEKFEDCMQGTQSFAEMREQFQVDFNSYVSGALISDNTLRDGNYAFRFLSNKESDAFEGTMEQYAKKVGSVEAAYASVAEKWAPAIESFKDGDIYNHKEDTNLPTYSYEYTEPDFPLNTLFHLTVMGLLAGGFGAGFTGKPSDAAKERAKKRDEQRAHIAKLEGRDNLPF